MCLAHVVSALDFFVPAHYEYDTYHRMIVREGVIDVHILKEPSNVLFEKLFHLQVVKL